MKKLSGLVLDRYDLLVEPDTTLEGPVSDLLKIAHRFSPEELSRLPDDTFAVILQDGDTTMKKFSMADAGNTALSVLYFMENGHKLPAEAQEVAAANLIKGCGWYSIATPKELEKVALGLGGLAMGALMVPGAMREAKNNLAVAKPAGPAIMTPDQIKQQRLQMGV